MTTTQQPQEPQRSTTKEEKAQLELDQYKPGFIDRLFKREDKKRQKLAKKLESARKADEESYSSELSDWKKEFEEWRESVNLAEALLRGDAKAKIEAIEHLRPFSEISNLGSSLSITVHDNGLLETTVNVHGVDIVPNESKSILKSGKLSVKDMPKGKFNEIYQDYVCSCVLRIANELLSAIPDKMVIVTAVDDLLNSKTGHLEEMPILSVAVSRSTISSLNLETLAELCSSRTNPLKTIS